LLLHRLEKYIKKYAALIGTAVLDLAQNGRIISMLESQPRGAKPKLHFRHGS
jgi:hypothetical protein